MANLYKCENCGREWEIPEGHTDNDAEYHEPFYCGSCDVCESY